MSVGKLRWPILAVCLYMQGCAGAADNGAAPDPATVAAPLCRPGSAALLQATLRGAVNAQLDWRGDAMQCEGGVRPDGSGIRLSISGPLPNSAQRLRLIFGINAGPGITLDAAIPTNVTALIEGGARAFATQGDNKCTVESLNQDAADSSPLDFTIRARGFCIGPAITLDGSGSLYIDRFDFTTAAHFEATDAGDASALPGFERSLLEIRTAAGKHWFNIAVAGTEAQDRQGLMLVRHVPDDFGMLFPLAQPRTMYMWMKNTLIPLDMLFIDARGRVACLRENARPLDLANIGCDQPVKAVLEIAGGQAKMRGITVGDTVVHHLITG